jgi:hypothetical protein
MSIIQNTTTHMREWEKMKKMSENPLVLSARFIGTKNLLFIDFLQGKA